MTCREVGGACEPDTSQSSGSDPDGDRRGQESDTERPGRPARGQFTVSSGSDPDGDRRGQESDTERPGRPARGQFTVSSGSGGDRRGQESDTERPGRPAGGQFTVSLLSVLGRILMGIDVAKKAIRRGQDVLLEVSLLSVYCQFWVGS